MISVADQVGLELITNDIGHVVRFMREAWSTSLGRTLRTVELIIIVKHGFEDDIKRDFETYRLLPPDAQRAFLESLRVLACYTSRRLPDQEPQAIPSSILASAEVFQQTSLF